MFMHKEFFVYVVIPVYKAEKYIARTLDSVLAQPYPNIRIVCVDDGSPDHSIDILRAYEAKYSNVHVIRQENAGVSAARNAGIEYVLREDDNGYLTFLDSDDLWAKNAAACFEEDLTGHPDCVGYRYVRCSDDLTKAADSPGLEARELPGGSRSLWCHSDYPFGAVLYSCRFLKTYPIRFVDKLSYAEDSIFKFTCFYLAERIKLVDRVLYCYRINAASAMHKRKYGTDYMPPIIRGYLKTAEFLRPYENEQRGSAGFAYIMAGIHAMEMAQEHYRKFRSAQGLERFLQENPDIDETIRLLDRRDLSEKHQQLYDQYHRSPLRFRLRCHLEGLKQGLMDHLKKLPPITKTLHQKRFPMPNEYL